MGRGRAKVATNAARYTALGVHGVAPCIHTSYVHSHIHFKTHGNVYIKTVVITNAPVEKVGCSAKKRHINPT